MAEHPRLNKVYIHAHPSPRLCPHADPKPHALPVPAENRGLVFLVNYTSHESPYPTPDVHAFAIYLPAGYINAADNE